VNFAQNQGKLVVSAAGNFGVNLDKDKNFTQIPADAGAGIAVWAGDIDGNLAGYSNHGRATWVGAGGGDFTPGSPNIPLPGCFFGGQDGILSACSTKSVVFPICGTANDFYLLGFSGTSFATPVVAGVAALVDGAAGGSLNPGQLKTVLKNTADDIGPNGTDVLFSHGRVNAGRAVE
jgi:subtilisin family serine protease